jgi:hypothetical protein
MTLQFLPKNEISLAEIIFAMRSVPLIALRGFMPRLETSRCFGAGFLRG